MEAAICHPLINWYQLELHPYVDCRDPLSTSSVWWSTFGQFPPKWQSYLKSQLQIPVPWSFQKGDPSQDRCWCILTRVHQASPQHTPESPFPAARSQWQTMETQDGPFHVPCAAGSRWQASVFELNNVALILDKKIKTKSNIPYIYISIIIQNPEHSASPVAPKKMFFSCFTGPNRPSVGSFFFAALVRSTQRARPAGPRKPGSMAISGTDWTNIAMENHHFSWENPL